MPSDKHNLITAKAMSYECDIFTAIHCFSPTSVFWHTAVYTMHGSWTYLCLPLYPFTDITNVSICGNTIWLSGGWLLYLLAIFSVVTGLITETLIVLFFMCNRWNLAEEET